MPYMREGSCVYEQTKSGGKGKLRGCSDNPMMAKRYMRALYAHAEASVRNKAAAGDITVIFPLDANQDLINLQTQVKKMATGMSLIAPEDLHMTAVYTSGSDVAPLAEELSYFFDAFALVVDRVDQFETPDGYAIVARVRWSQDLSWAQERLFSALARQGGGMVSTFSLPGEWQPHITLGFSDSPIAPFEIKPFAILVDSIEVSDANKVPIMEVELKADPLVTKAFPVEIIAKSVRFNEEGDLIIPIKGVPFTGPVKGVADYQGDFFHKDTRIGDANEVNLFWDHGRDARYLIQELKSMGLDDDEIKSLGDDFGLGQYSIGKAVRDNTTPEAVFFNVIVNRSVKYKNAIYQAAMKGYIGASGEYKYFKYDPAVPGKVDEAPLVGMALTPSPFNTHAMVVKSVPLEGEMKKDEKQTGAPTEGAATEPAKTEQQSTPITDAIKEKASEIEVQTEKPQEKAQEVITLEAFNALKADLAAARAENQATQQIVKSFTDDLKTALPQLAELIAKSLKAEVGQQRQKSQLEIDAEQVMNRTNNSQQTPPVKTVLTHNKSAAMAGYPGSN